MANITISSPNVTRAANGAPIDRGAAIDVAVIHTTQSPERRGGARSVAANWFALTSAKASAHRVIDDTDVVRCVADNHVAWAAPGANRNGLQYELVGYAEQGPQDWNDAFSLAELDLAARTVAADCVKYGIPIKRLSVAELKAGGRGIIGHVDATHAFGGSHTDPGDRFPWERFLSLVRAYSGVKPAASKPSTAPTAKPSTSSGFPLPSGHFYGVNDRTANSHSGLNAQDNANVKRIQRVVGAAADGQFGLVTWARVVAWQKAHKLTADGLVGPATWKAMTL